MYGIPYRCLYSRNIDNLFLAGRIISASHVAFGSTRVMATCAHAAQAVATAAVICRRRDLLPRDVRDGEPLHELQQRLLARGQHIPGLSLSDPADLARSATIEASSEMALADLPADGGPVSLERSRAQMVPVREGSAPKVTFTVDVGQPTTLHAQLRISSKPDNHTPDVILAEQAITLEAGAEQSVTLDFDATLEQTQYAFYCLMANEHLRVRKSSRLVTGLTSVVYRRYQNPPEDLGVDAFEFWTPRPRPEGGNLAVQVDPPAAAFGPDNVTNGVQRPVEKPNAWVASPDDPEPTLTLRWDQPQRIGRIELAFDTDFDHAMQSVLIHHPERVMPYCVKAFDLIAVDESGDEKMLHTCPDNHETRRTVTLDAPVQTDTLRLRVREMNGPAPTALFEIRCYAA